MHKNFHTLKPVFELWFAGHNTFENEFQQDPEKQSEIPGVTRDCSSSTRLAEYLGLRVSWCDYSKTTVLQPY